MKFPSQYYVTNPPRPDLDLRSVRQPPVDSPEDVFDLVGRSLKMARHFRSMCIAAERELWKDPSLRQPFSRDEMFTNKWFPFL